MTTISNAARQASVLDRIAATHPNLPAGYVTVLPGDDEVTVQVDTLGDALAWSIALGADLRVEDYPSAPGHLLVRVVPVDLDGTSVRVHVGPPVPADEYPTYLAALTADRDEALGRAS